MERMIETELGPLATYERGAGPAVFLWPSLYLDHRSLDGLIGELAADHRCVVVDGPGHGRSPGPGRPYDLAACARAAVQVLDALRLDRVDWVGNAWGGHVGARAAIDVPARLRTLTMIASPLQPLAPKVRLQKRLLLAMLRVGLADRAGALLASAMLSPSAPVALHDEVRRVVREAPRAGLAEAMRSISLRRPDLLPEVPRIACPTLLIAGADDQMYPPSLAREQAARIPGARVETVAGAAHLAPMERPVETAGRWKACG